MLGKVRSQVGRGRRGVPEGGAEARRQHMRGVADPGHLGIVRGGVANQDARPQGLPERSHRFGPGRLGRGGAPRADGRPHVLAPRGERAGQGRGKLQGGGQVLGRGRGKLELSINEIALGLGLAVQYMPLF